MAWIDPLNEEQPRKDLPNMVNRRKFVKALSTGAALLPALPIYAATKQGVICSHAPAGPSAHLFPDVVVMNQFGQRMRFYNDLIKGKIVTINFFFTQCEELCPRLMANLVQLQKRLGARVGKDIFMYSLTLDANYDTPRVLRAYAEKLGIGPGWELLTGDPATLEILRKKMEFTDPDPALDKLKSAHTGLVRYGNEKLDRWAGCPGITRPAELARRIALLEPPLHPQGKRILDKNVLKYQSV